MASKKRTVEIEIVADDRKAKAALSGIGNEATTTGRKFSDASKVIGAALAAGAGAAVGRFVVDSIKSFSELEQSIGGTEAVFGDASDSVDRFADTSAKSIGLAESEFRTATTLIGGQLKRMTGDVDFAAEQSIVLTKTAADLAATYGGTTKEAVEALSAAFRGEADPAERFNLDLKIGKVNAKALEMGLVDASGKVDDYSRAQATLALVAEQSADAQGQFARELDTVAGQAQVVAAQFEDMKAQLGASFASAAVEAMGSLQNLMDAGSEEMNLGWSQRLSAAMQTLLGESKESVEEYIKQKDAQNDAADAASRAAPKYKTLAGEMNQLAVITGYAKEETKEAATEVQNLGEEMLAAADPAFNLMKRHEGFVSAQQKYNDAVGEFGRDSQQAREAQAELLQSAGGLNAAQQKFAEEWGPEGEAALRDLGRQAGLYGDDLESIIDFLKGIARETRNLPPVMPGAGPGGGGTRRFHQGGIVQGTPGEDVPIIAQAGERVLSRGQTNLGSGGGGVVINIHGFVGSEMQVAQEIDRVLTRFWRKNGR